MGTRSRIGLQLEDGSVLSVYHHWDGYPSGLGKKLVKDYNSKDKISELIDGGDMSSCMSTHNWDMEEVPEHVQYYSLRGEDTPPAHHDTLEDFLSYQCDGEYAYLWRNNQWDAWETDNFGQFMDNPRPNKHARVAIPTT